MATINTSFAALKAQQNLNNTGAKLSTSIERLSSGLRINSAKDDAAGQAIGNRMATNLQANSTITRGINDGVSLGFVRKVSSQAAVYACHAYHRPKAAC
ncbi:flagellin N-terminal helical domain-containing protein [Vreelandella stevensii]|uniref:flagellin N-terminal helical domain-containing protein n=1 Tax=Vreelandella stevensii TaxID=502821 RepID=UPI000A05B941